MQIFKTETALFPDITAGDYIMKNEKFIEVLKQLKEEGISYKSLAQNSNIPTASFYYYLKNNRFPYTARKQIEAFILNEYREIIEL